MTKLEVTDNYSAAVSKRKKLAPRLKPTAARNSQRAWVESLMSREPTDDCILCDFCPDRSGYATITKDKKTRKVTHLVLEMFGFGTKPLGMQVCHSCHTRACVNIKHLRWCTPKENMLDMVSAGRQCSGTKHPRSTLAASDVREIYQSKQPRLILSQKFGVSAAAISRIRNGHTYKLITQEFLNET